MEKSDSNASNFGLKGKRVEDLRALAIKYLGINAGVANGLDKKELINKLTAGINKFPLLAREIKKASVSIKPSFYTMILTPLGETTISLPKAKSKIQDEFNKLDLKYKSESAIYKGFTVEDVTEHSEGVIEFQFVWQHIHWFWEPITVTLNHIYEFRFGFIILDFKSRKAIVACQTEQERKIISGILSKIYPINLTSLVLTKPLLDQIGSFEHVKRAGYFIANTDKNSPSNITYADENLGAKTLAKNEEANFRSQRKHSFYLIPLGTIEEQGVGATSDSGKLWISREIPIDTVRQYGMELLKKISKSLDDMTKRKEYSKVLESLGIKNLQGINSIKSIKLRKQISFLIEEITHMLIRNEYERPYTPDLLLVIDGVPDLFEYPRLQLVDEVSHEISYWKNPDGSSQLVKTTKKKEEVEFIGFPYGEIIDIKQLKHPITGNKVKIDEPISALFLTPTLKLHDIVLEAIVHISQQISPLQSITCIPFFLLGNTLHLDVDRAFGKSGLETIGKLLNPKDITEMSKSSQHNVPSKDREAIKKTLIALGEKCKHMSDEMCRTCVLEAQNKKLCLRSLVARQMKDPLLLAHKGIELSDLQGQLTVSRRLVSVFGFAKLASSSKEGLTARNKNGAILLAQVLGQVDKPDFNIVMVISPSTINEDLRNRLLVLSGVFNKVLLLLDEVALASFLIDFQFDNKDYKTIYKNSTKKTIK